MAKQSIDILKGWFETGDYPTQQQFYDWLDSFRHKDDEVAMDDVTDLSDTLRDKADLVDGKVPLSQLPDGLGSGGGSSVIVLDAGATEWTAPAACLLEIIAVFEDTAIAFTVGTTDGGSEILANDVEVKGVMQVLWLLDEDNTIYFGGVTETTIIKLYIR